MQLLQVRAIDDPKICAMLEKKAGKYILKFRMK